MLQDSIKRILKKEYDIENVQVKIIGKTLGVHLPLEKLFSANLDSFSDNTDEKSVEDLFKFDPHAMEKIEHVLFSMSRVIMSTDRPLDFYVLKAAETETTGIELILTGYISDMKRVRFWDIAISEYRKRLLHDLSVNRTIIWKRTIRDFFNHISQLSLTDLMKQYFTTTVTFKDISPFFYSQLAEAEYKDKLQFKLLRVKTKPISEKEVLVYVKVHVTYIPYEGYEQYEFLFENNAEHEYLFILQAEMTSYKIHRIIPFYYIDENRTVHTLDFPEELKIFDNIDMWSEEFELEEVFMGSFLAQQLTKRVQALIVQDERIQSIFPIVKGEFTYYEPITAGEGTDTEAGYYSFNYLTQTKDDLFSRERQTPSEDEMRGTKLYLLSKVFEEFTKVVYSYKFKDFEYVRLYNEMSKESITIPANRLEQFRKNKITIDALIGGL
ncbi:MAG: hypothetical protein KKH94_10430 [Candidatus Omnitrophica bacterium]|nr:hypothetical protein [Candidatus Omnitrophota bacterium]